MKIKFFLFFSFIHCNSTAMTAEQLEEAIRKGDVDQISRYLDEGGSVDTQIYEYEAYDAVSMLDTAIRFQKMNIVDLLISKGAKFSTSTKFLRYVVAEADSEKYLSIVKGLLDAKANPNFKDDKASPISQALLNNDLGMVKLLLDCKANIDETELKKTLLYKDEMSLPTSDGIKQLLGLE